MVERRLPLFAAFLAQSALALSGGPAHGEAQDSESAKYQQWKTAAVQTLAERPDADSVATAAAVSYAGSDKLKTNAAALGLAGRAAELAPQDAAVGWLRLQLCVHAPPCDVRAAATAMRWLDADNAAAWLPTLAAAERDRDSTEIDRILAGMAHGKRFDVYWNRIVVFMFDALKEVATSLPGDRTNSDSKRLLYVMGIASGELIPSFTALAEPCKDSAAGPERRESCLKVARMMQQGDTVLVQMMGLGIERRLAPPDGKEARGIGERKRQLEWRMTTAAKFDNPVFPWLWNAHARWRLARMRATPREEDVLIAILRKQGLAIEPPGGGHL